MHDIFYFTDIHGSLDFYTAIKQWCFKQDKECTIIFGGDACDRGPNGYQIIKDMLNNPQILYLKGNHEDLFVQAAKELIEYYGDNLYNCHDENAVDILINNCDTYNINLHCRNGGYSTLRDWLLDGANEEIINKIDALPVTAVYNNIDFCHAGGVWSAFEDVNNAEYNDIHPTPWALDKCLWDRNSIAVGWPTDRICVHGHTPTVYLPRGIYGKNQKEKNAHPCAWQDHMGLRKKFSGWKIDMDTGAIFTNRAYVLNILTLVVYGFKNENNIIKRAFEQYKIINN